MLSSLQKDLLRQVITAAREGRYCHGNGANWVFVDKSDTSRVIHVDHVRGTREVMNAADSEKYLRNSKPYHDEATAKSLENFIK
jgi:prepilin-type processing-associated H-X9-DG protein